MTVKTFFFTIFFFKNLEKMPIIKYKSHLKTYLGFLMFINMLSFTIN